MRIGSIAMALLMAGCSATADDAQLNPTEVETAADREDARMLVGPCDVPQARTRGARKTT